jgi:hypothetical protein
MIPQYRKESREADCTLELMAGNFVREILSEIKDRKPKQPFFESRGPHDETPRPKTFKLFSKQTCSRKCRRTRVCELFANRRFTHEALAKQREC